MTLNILLFEEAATDDPMLARALEAIGNLSVARDTAEAVLICTNTQPDVVILRSGNDAGRTRANIRSINAIGSGAYVGVATRGFALEDVVRLVRAGADDVVALIGDPNGWAEVFQSSLRRMRESRKADRDIRIELGTPLKDAEMAIIQSTIKLMNNSVPKAAQVLGVSPSTLYRKFERAGMGIDGENLMV